MHLALGGLVRWLDACCSELLAAGCWAGLEALFGGKHGRLGLCTIAEAQFRRETVACHNKPATMRTRYTGYRQ